MSAYRIFADGDVWGFDILERGVPVTTRTGYRSAAAARSAAIYFGG